MIDAETLVREQLSKLDPLPTTLSGDWDDVLSRVQRPAPATRLRRLVSIDLSPGGRRRRIAIAIAVLALLIAIPAFAIAGDWGSPPSWARPDAPHGPQVTVASGIEGGISWKLALYIGGGDQVCTALTVADDYYGSDSGCSGESASTYSSSNGEAPADWVGGEGMTSERSKIKWFVLGPVAKSVDRVSIRLRSGAEVPATIVPVPAQLGADVSFYYALSTDPDPVTAVVARSKDGTVLETYRFLSWG
jgi:hypothetical protein